MEKTRGNRKQTNNSNRSKVIDKAYEELKLKKRNKKHTEKSNQKVNEQKLTQVQKHRRPKSGKGL